MSVRPGNRTMRRYMSEYNLPYRRNDDKHLRPQLSLKNHGGTLATLADRNAALVALGSDALARGKWAMVRATTWLIQARGWRHE
jgi:hypothetical protein